VQGLVDVRNALDRRAAASGASPVEWHFGGLANRWARRALAVAGFGFPVMPSPVSQGQTQAPGQSRDQTGAHYPLGGWEPVYTVASSLAGATAEDIRRAKDREGNPRPGEEEGKAEGRKEATAALHAVDRPFFHVDLVEAVDAAVRDAKRMDERENMQSE
jgi:solute carrier family 26 (sodium-independent sulfate anion transporter), member 11